MLLHGRRELRARPSLTICQTGSNTKITTFRYPKKSHRHEVNQHRYHKVLVASRLNIIGDCIPQDPGSRFMTASLDLALGHLQPVKGIRDRKSHNCRAGGGREKSCL